MCAVGGIDLGPLHSGPLQKSTHTEWKSFNRQAAKCTKEAHNWRFRDSFQLFMIRALSISPSVWLGALRNYASRIDDIAKAHECVPLSVGAYNSLALSTFGYIA